MRTTQELTLPKLKMVIRATVQDELRALLDDPDFGLQLRASVRSRLALSEKSKRTGRVISADRLVARLGLRV